MMKQSRHLIEKRNNRNGRKRLYAPHIHWRKWLYSGSQEDEALPQSGRKAVRQGIIDENPDDDIDTEPMDGTEDRLSRNPTLNEDLERAPAVVNSQPQSRDGSPDPDLLVRALDDSQQRSNLKQFSSSFRGRLADAVEYIQDSEDISYAMKFTVGVFLLSWPAFVPSLNSWYSFDRGGTFCPH